VQIDIPHSIYGRSDYFVPKPIADWLKAHNLGFSLCGRSSDGRGTVESHYMVDGASVEDAIAFKLHFPDCRVHHYAL
jgi:hypothetical protein